MRSSLFIVAWCCAFCLSAEQIPAWKWHGGLMAGLNTCNLNVSSDIGGTLTSGSQWSAGFGVFCKSNTKNQWRFEFQLAYETTGAPKEIYFPVSDHAYARVYDRYRTLPAEALLIRNLGWKESVSFGFGFKSSFIMNYKVRHDAPLPASTGIIISPDVIRWFGSPVIQASLNLDYGEIALQGWYAVTPLIDSDNVRAAPMGIALQVKARLYGSDSE